MSIFFGGATERSVTKYGSVKSDIKTGYYLGTNRVMANILDVVNYNNFEKTVYVYSEIEYLPGKPTGFIDTGLHLLNPGLCGGQQGTLIHLPKGVTKFQVNSTGIVAAFDGYIVNMSTYFDLLPFDVSH
jgi:hypothetical protein